MKLKSLLITLLSLAAGTTFAADPERVFGCRSGLLHVYKTGSGFEYTFEANDLAAYGTARPNRQALSVDIEPFLRDSGCRKNTVARLEAAFAPPVTAPVAEAASTTAPPPGRWSHDENIKFLQSLVEAEQRSSQSRDSTLQRNVGCVSRLCQRGSVCEGNMIVGTAMVAESRGAPVLHPNDLSSDPTLRLQQICDDRYICTGGRMQRVFQDVADRWINNGYRRSNLPASLHPDNLNNKGAMIDILRACHGPIGLAASNTGWSRRGVDGRQTEGRLDAIESLFNLGIPSAQTAPGASGQSPTGR